MSALRIIAVHHACIGDLYPGIMSEAAEVDGFYMLDGDLKESSCAIIQMW